MSEKIPEGVAPPDEFDLNYQFFKYLKLAKLDPRGMKFEQYAELKRAFFGALGQMLVIYMHNVPNMPEKQSTPKILWMRQQIQDFWEAEVARKTTPLN